MSGSKLQHTALVLVCLSLMVVLTANTPIPTSTPMSVFRRPYNGIYMVLPTRVEAEHFDEGENGVTYYDQTRGSFFGVSYRSTGWDADIKPLGSDWLVGFFQTGEWVEYTLGVSRPNTRYALRARGGTAETSAPRQIRLWLNGVDATGAVTVPVIPDWNSPTEFTLPEVWVGTRFVVLRVEVVSGFVDLDWIEFTPVDNTSVPPTATLTPFATETSLSTLTSTATPTATPLPTETPVSLPERRLYNGIYMVLPTRVEAEHFDEGENGVTYYDQTRGSFFGVSYRSTGWDADIKPLGSDWLVGFFQTGEWVEYTLGVSRPNTRYALRARGGTAETSAPRQIRLWLNGVDATGAVTVPVIPDWNSPTEFTLPEVWVGTRFVVLRVEVVSGFVDLDWIEFTTIPDTPAPPTTTASEIIDATPTPPPLETPLASATATFTTEPVTVPAPALTETPLPVVPTEAAVATETALPSITPLPETLPG